MNTGDLITITAHGIEATPAEVAGVHTVDELPDVAAIELAQRQPWLRPPRRSDVQAILREMGVTHVAAITHLHDGKPVVFVALEFGRAGWFDLKGTRLIIEPREEATCT
jgi:hypothetical protein